MNNLQMPLKKRVINPMERVVHILLPIGVALWSVVSWPALAVDAWQWQEECRISGAKTTCEVWWNSTLPLETVNVSSGDTQLNAEFRSYGDQGQNSANVFLFQVQDMSERQLQQLRDAVTAAISNMRSHQKVAIYQSGEDLRVLSPLNTPSSGMSAALGDMTVEQTPSGALDSLEELFQIAPAMNAERKVVYWITSGVRLLEAERQNLIARLADAPLRVVFIHLQKFELSANEEASLRVVAESSGSVFSSVRAEVWADAFGWIPGYSDNGGTVVIDSSELCGDVTLNFTAPLDGDATIAGEWQGAYPACQVSGPEDDPPDPQEPVVPDPQEPVVPDPQEPVVPDPQEPVVPDPQEPVVPDPQEPVVSDPQEPMVPDPQEPVVPDPQEPVVPDPPVDPNMPGPDPEPEPDYILWIVIALGLVVVTSLAAIIVVRQRRASKQRVAAMEVRADAEYEHGAAWGFLIQFTGTEEVRHALRKRLESLGRGQDNDIVLSNDDTVSAEHAVIKRDREGIVTLVDTRSSNGVKVDNEEVQSHVLKGGEIIQLGSTTLRYEKG